MIVERGSVADKNCPQRFDRNGYASPCIGSECMAWRWADPLRLRGRRAENVNATIEEPRPEGLPASWQWIAADPSDETLAGWSEPESEALARRRGFCGLASVPAEVPAITPELMQSIGQLMAMFTREAGNA